MRYLSVVTLSIRLFLTTSITDIKIERRCSSRSNRTRNLFDKNVIISRKICFRGRIYSEGIISAVNGDGITSDADERTLPLLVAESRGALEDNLGALLEVAQVKSLASRNLDVVQGDCRARLLVLHGIGGTTGTAEGTAIGALVDRRRGSDDGGGGQRHRGEGRDEVNV